MLAQKAPPSNRSSSRQQSGAARSDDYDFSDGSVSEVTLGSLDGDDLDEPRKASATLPLEAPLPPHELQPYRATILGLDKARRDCLPEMSKIARELNALAVNPNLASDPDRAFRFVSPAVFRQLLPRIQSADRKAEEELENTMKNKARSMLETLRDSARCQIAELADATAKVSLGVTFRPYNGYCPVPLDTPVHFHTVYTKRAMDYDHHAMLFHIWEPHQGPNQMFVVLPGRVGYLIRHATYKRFVAIGRSGDSDMLHLLMNEVGSEFVFEPNGDQTCAIFLAEPKGKYHMNPRKRKADNGTAIVLSPSGVDCNSPWLVRCQEE